MFTAVSVFAKRNVSRTNSKDPTPIVLVVNRKYLRKCLSTVIQIRTVGKFTGNIILVLGRDLESRLFALSRIFLNISPIYLGEIELPQSVKSSKGLKNNDRFSPNKIFQYQKFLLFHEFFKQWDRILYVDSGMRVFRPIEEFLQLDCGNGLIAHSDSFPDFSWKLKDQFNWEKFPGLLDKMEEVLDVNQDYFQTTFLFFDTSIISKQSIAELTALLSRFPNSRTNDQGIMNLWALPQSIWKPLHSLNRKEERLYDFLEREQEEPREFIFLKYPRKETQVRKLYFYLLSRLSVVEVEFRYYVSQVVRFFQLPERKPNTQEKSN